MKRILALFALLCIVVPGMARLPASHAVAARSAPVPLGGTNEISGKTTGYVRVSLAKRAVLDYGAMALIKGGYPRLVRKAGPSPSIDVVGKGDFIGLSMTPDRDGAAPLFVSGQFRGKSEVDRIVNFSSPLLGRRIELDAGLYRVYLIADGQPAKVRFRFESGPSGTQHLTPTVSTHSEGHTSDAFTKVGELGAMQAVNEHTVKSKRSFGVDLLSVHGGEEIIEGMGVCIRDIDDGEPVERFGPRCPGALEEVFVAEASGRPDTYFLYLEHHGITKGRWGLGGWYAGDARPDYLGLHSLTVDRG